MYRSEDNASPDLLSPRAEGAPLATSIPFASRWGPAMLLVGAYVLTGKLGIQWATVHGTVTPIYPAAGVAVAGLLLGGLRLWPAVVLGRLLLFWTDGVKQDLWLQIVVALGTTSAAVVAVYGAGRWGGFDPRLRRLRDALWLIGWVALAAPVVGATICVGAIDLAFHRSIRQAVDDWFSWWVANIAGILIVVPLVLGWCRGASPRLGRMRDWMHFAMSVAAAGLVAWVVFVGVHSAYLRSWLVFPVLMWAALAFGVRGAATAMVPVAVFAIAGTLAGNAVVGGRFDSDTVRIAVLQQLIFAASASSLVLAVVADERRGRDALLLSQAELSRSEARFRGLADASPVAISLSRAGRHLYVNPAYRRCFGLPAEVDLAGSPIFDQIAPEDRERIGRNVQRRHAGEVVDATYEFTGLRVDGTRFDVEVYVGQFPLPDGPASIAFLTDVSERKAAAATLAAVAEETRRARDQLEAVVNSMSDGVMVADAAGNLLFMNPACLRVHGYGSLDQVRQHLSQFLELFEARDDAGQAVPLDRWALSRVLRGESFQDYELVIQRKDTGARFCARYSGTPVRDEAGNVLMAVVLITDVTARRDAEQERARLLEAERAARQEAEHAVRAKDQFLAALSHELRTPLTPVLLTVSLLEASPQFPQSLREELSAIRRSVELEARLIDDLLDLTRIARGKIGYDFQTADVHLLLRSAISICCTDGKLAVTTDFGATRTRVWADPARLQQVFWNLLNNAWKFTPPGGSVTIRTENDGDRFILEITDTGPGMTPELLPRVFDAFEQGDATRARRFGGLGLGLAISKALVEAHQGRISAHSGGAGLGATFRVELPCAAVSESTSLQAPLDRDSGTAADRKLRLLLVEDHPSTLRALTLLLGTIGHDVDSASSVAGGLDAARSASYDLVISDLGLPDGTGFDLMRQLQENHGLRGIALSGYGMEDDVARSLAAGFAEHLTKPVDLQKLRDAIARATTP